MYYLLIFNITPHELNQCWKIIVETNKTEQQLILINYHFILILLLWSGLIIIIIISLIKISSCENYRAQANQQ